MSNRRQKLNLLVSITLLPSIACASYFLLAAARRGVRELATAAAARVPAVGQGAAGADPREAPLRPGALAPAADVGLARAG